MIYGIGVDLVARARIERLYKKFGHSFAAKILSAPELMMWQTSSQNIAFLAKRFAAKEAFAKAVRTGLIHPVSLHQIGVTHDEAGGPEFMYQPLLAAWLREKAIARVHLSLTDEEDYVTAFAVAEQA